MTSRNTDKVPMRTMIGVLFLLLLTTSAQAAPPPSTLSYQGRILKSDGTPISGSVPFRVEIRSPLGTNCLMYSEDRTVMIVPDAKGAFSFAINDSGRTRTDSALYSFEDIFKNRGSFTLSGCDSGTNFTPDATMTRSVVVMFQQGGVWETLPTMTTTFVPQALDSLSLGGYGSGDLLSIGTTNPTQKLLVNGGNIFLNAPTPVFAINETNNSGNQYQITVDTNVMSLGRYGTGPLTKTLNIFGDSVGIGTTSPSGVLHTLATGAVYFDRAGSATGSHLLLRGGLGTPSAPTATTSGSGLGQVSFQGYDGAAWTTGYGSWIASSATEIWSSTNHGSNLIFSTNAAGSAGVTTERLRIDSSGNVGIGTTVPAARLDITGTGDASAIIVPRDTTRPTTGVNGMIRYNMTANTLEAFANGSWQSLAGAGTGAYLPLAGGTMSGAINMGGQTLRGGTAASASLTLESTSDATKGSILLNPSGGVVGIGTTSPAATLDVASVSTDGNLGFTVRDNEQPGTLSTVAGVFGGSLTMNMSGGQGDFDIINRYPSSSAGIQGFRFMQQTGVGAFSTLMTIDGDSGSVGIGSAATTPGYPLDLVLAGTSTYTSSSTSVTAPFTAADPVLRIRNTTSTLGSGAYLTFQTFSGGGTNAQTYIGSFAETNGSAQGAIAFGSRTAATSYQEYARIASSGNVGIGTSLPSSRLDVFGTGDASAIIVPRDTTRPTTGVNGMIRYNMTANTLEAFANGSWQSLAGAGTGAYLPLAGGTMSGAINMGGQTLRGGSAASASLTLESTSDATKGAVILNPTAGNVGIGTSSPVATLDIVGNVRVQSSNYATRPAVTAAQLSSELTANNSAGNDWGYLRLSAGGGTSVLSKSFIDLAGYSTGSDVSKTITFGTAGVERARIDAVGRVGIGTAAPAKPFHVRLATNQSIMFTQDGDGGDTGAATLMAANDAVNSLVPMAIGASRFNLYGGNVGIGTTNPTQKLDVNGSMNSGHHNIVSSAQYNGLTLSNGTYSPFKVYGSTASNDSGVLELSSGGTKTVQISAGNGIPTYFNFGNVGIGTTSPSNKLVVGDDAYGASAVPGNTLTVGNAAGASLVGVGQSASARALFGWSYNATPASAFARLTTSGANPLVLQENGGNVGIGTTAPLGSMHIVRNSSNYAVNINDTWLRAAILAVPSTSGTEAFSVSRSPSAINLQSVGTDGTTAYDMTLNPFGGRVAIGTTVATGKLEINGGAANAITGLTINTTSVGANKYESYKANGTEIGSISSAAGANVSFNTTSDVRLKGGFAPVLSPLTKLNEIEVSNFYYLSDPLQTRMDGFKAQQLYTVVPYAVTKPVKDVADDGTLNPWQADYSKIVPLITAAVQELYREVLGVKVRQADHELGLASIKSETANLKQELQAKELRIQELERLNDQMNRRLEKLERLIH